MNRDQINEMRRLVFLAMRRRWRMEVRRATRDAEWAGRPFSHIKV